MLEPIKPKPVNPEIKFQIEEILYDGDEVQNNKLEPQEESLYSKLQN